MRKTEEHQKEMNEIDRLESGRIKNLRAGTDDPAGHAGMAPHGKRHGRKQSRLHLPSDSIGRSQVDPREFQQRLY